MNFESSFKQSNVYGNHSIVRFSQTLQGIKRKTEVDQKETGGRSEFSPMNL